MYVRSYRGRAGQWFQEISAFPFALLHTRGEQLVVRAIPITDEATIARVSQGLFKKYPTSSYVSPMVRDEILETTLRLEPATGEDVLSADMKEQNVQKHISNAKILLRNVSCG